MLSYAYKMDKMTSPHDLLDKGFWDVAKDVGLLTAIGLLFKTFFVDRRKVVDDGELARAAQRFNEAESVQKRVDATTAIIMGEIHRKEDAAQGRETAMQMQIVGLEKQMQEMLVQYTKDLGDLRLAHSQEIASYQKQLIEKELEHIRVVSELQLLNKDLIYKLEQMERKIPKRIEDYKEN